eukprot:10358788-Ditylum_brightwellii.AAC.1
MNISAYCPQKVCTHLWKTLLRHYQEEGNLTSKNWEEDHGDEAKLLNKFGLKMIKAVKDGLNE